MKDVYNLIKKLNISELDNVVLACSYGPDSMCLLDILKCLNINVIVAHVNHKLRSASDKEYLDLKKYCDKNNLIFEGIEIDKEPIGNAEEFFRNFRYNFFDRIVKKYNSKYLFTAHHGDDLIETILMRISRGASFGGYAGFKTITKLNGYYLIRPLIYLTKEEILEYVNSNNIPYAIDESNLTNDYTRNKYRHEILPVLKSINPNIHKKFIKFSNTLYEYNQYLEKEVSNLYSNLYINNRIDLNDFMGLPMLLQKELLRKILSGIYKERINLINDKHLELIRELINGYKVNSSINLPNKILVSRYYNIIEFGSLNEYHDYDVILNNEYIIDRWKILVVDNTDIIKSNYIIRLNSKELKLPLHIRNRKVADKMELKNGTKKVGEILSENKMPKNLRDICPILTDSVGKILWIPGIKKSKFDKQINEDYDIIIKCIKKEANNEE